MVAKKAIFANYRNKGYCNCDTKDFPINGSFIC